MEAEADAGNRDRQVRELPPVQRQVLDAAGVDDTADRGGGGVDQRRPCRHGDVFGHLRDPDVEVRRDRLGNADLDRALLGLEARHLDRDRVAADRQSRDPVDALGITDFTSREAGAVVLGGDGRARDRRLLFVEHAPGDRARRLLRERRGGPDEQPDRREQQAA